MRTTNLLNIIPSRDEETLLFYLNKYEPRPPTPLVPATEAARIAYEKRSTRDSVTYVLESGEWLNTNAIAEELGVAPSNVSNSLRSSVLEGTIEKRRSPTSMLSEYRAVRDGD